MSTHNTRKLYYTDKKNNFRTIRCSMFFSKSKIHFLCVYSLLLFNLLIRHWFTLLVIFLCLWEKNNQTYIYGHLLLWYKKIKYIFQLKYSDPNKDRSGRVLRINMILQWSFSLIIQFSSIRSNQSIIFQVVSNLIYS